MANVSRTNGRSSWWRGVASIFDLMGCDFISKKEFDRIRFKKSKIKIEENDLEIFIQDLGKTVGHYDKKIEATTGKK